MKKIMQAFVLVQAAAAACLAWAGQSGAPGDPLYEQGRKIFNANCRVCHILRSEGDTPSPYYLRFRPGDFSDQDFWKTHDDKKIENSVRKGKGAMPPQNLDSEEIKALVRYMNIEFRGKQP